MLDRNDICTGCVWWETWACDADKEFPCSKYIGVNDKDYEKLITAHQDDVDAALAPIREQWKKYIFEDYYK